MQKYLLLFIFTCSVCGEWVRDLNVALKKAKEEQKYILLYFAEKDSCGLCSEFSQKIATQKKFIDIFKQESVLCVIDPKFYSDKEKCLQLFRMFQIDKIPTVMFMTAKGKVFFRNVYNGEKFREYSLFLQNILRAQKAYEEIISNFTEEISFSKEEKEFLCKELAENLDQCPSSAWTLQSKFAYHLFHMDERNITKKKAHAAYLVCLYTKLDKKIYLNYLKTSNNTEKYYEKLLGQFFIEHAEKLAHLYGLSHHEKKKKYIPQLKKYAKQIIKECQKYTFVTNDKKIKLNMFITKALCYRSLGDKENFNKIWIKIKKDYSKHEKYSSLYNLLQLESTK